MAEVNRRGGLGRGLAALIPPGEEDRATLEEIAVSAIIPNPRQPRGVFDDEEIEGLAQSIRDVGVLQPIVVRPLGWAPVRADRRRAAPASLEGRGPDPDPRGGAPHRGRGPAQGSADREHPPGAAQPAGGGCGLPAAARGLRGHPGGARAATREVPAHDHQRHAPALAAARRAAPGGRRACCRPVTPRRCWPCPTGPARSTWPTASWRRGCRCARPRRSCGCGCSTRTTRRPAGSAHGFGAASRQRRGQPRSRKVTAPGLIDLQDDLSDALAARVKISMGARKGNIRIEFGSVDDLERIVGVIARGLQTDISLGD